MHICKLGLPNLEYYFWAAQLKPLTAWLRDLTDARWLNIEKSLCQQSLSELPFLDISLKNTEMGEWTMSTLKIWRNTIPVKITQTNFLINKHRLN